MLSSRRLAYLALAAVLTAVALSQMCCTEVEGPVMPEGDLTTGFNPVVPAPVAPGQMGPRPAAPAGQARREIAAPVRGETVAGGELPKLEGFPGEFKLGKGATLGSIRIFPIYSTRKLEVPQEYISLAEAQEKGLVEISEQEQGATVNTVQITNKADKPIYIISGDIIKGGNQDRVIAMDMVIPPGKNEPVAVAVFCVERGRWAAGSTGQQFAGGEQACLNLKKSLGKGGVSQSAVWSKVGEINAKLETTSATSTYRKALEDESVSSKLEPYIEAFMKEFEKDDKIVGFAVCVGKKVVACDIFLNPSLLAKMRDKLIRSYVMGALTEEDKPGRPKATAGNVARFLDRVARAKVSLEKEDKNCKIFQLKDRDAEGFYSEIKGKKAHLFFGSK